MLISLAILSASPAAFAQAPPPQGIAIPAFYPLSSSAADWNRILAAQGVAKIVVIGLDSLGTGAGGGCTGSQANIVQCLHDNGQRILGYVDTKNGQRTSSNVLAGTDDISVQDYYNAAKFGGTIDGIFFDNGPGPTQGADTTLEAYYLNLFATVKSQRPGPCNGQACILINASQFEKSYLVIPPNDGVAPNGKSADWQIAYERPVHGDDNQSACGGGPDAQDYYGLHSDDARADANSTTGFCPDTGLGTLHCANNAMSPTAGWYFNSTNARKLAYVLRQPDRDASNRILPYVDANGNTVLTGGNATATPTDINNIISKGRTNYGAPGFVYIHDQGCLAPHGAYYSHLSRYFEQLVNAFAAPLTVNVTGNGSVVSTSDGIQCPGKCNNQVSNGTVVKLSAFPGTGASFQGFVVNGSMTVCGSSNPCSFAINGSATVDAPFNVTGVELTASKAGSGAGTVTSSPAGISCGTTCTSVKFSFSSGTLVTLTAAPAADSRFAGFSSNCAPVSGNPTQCQITMSAAATVFTTFTATKPLTVNKGGAGAGTVTSSPAGISCGTSCASVSQPFDSGATVTLTATPDANSALSSFSSNCTPVSGAPLQCTIVMSAAATVIATFGTGGPPKFWLTASKGGTGAGTVTLNDPGATSCGPTCASVRSQFDSGTPVTLTATPDANSSFTRFDPNCTPVPGTPTQCTITMSADATVTTTFTATKFPLTVSKVGTGSGTITSSPAGISCGPTCAGANSLFNSGNTVTLTAAPSAGSTFAGFGSNCAPISGNPTQCTIVMSGAATVTTNFTGTNVAPVVPPLFSDNFGRTTGLGADWHVWYGAYTTDGSSATSGTPPINGNWASVVPSMRTNDYAVVSDLVIPSGSLYSGVVARGSPSVFDDNLYAAQLSTDGNVYLYRRNNWNWTALGTTSAGITANTRYTLKLLVKGSNPVHLEVWLGGALQIEFDDASASRITSGVPGIENYDPNVRYSSFAVYPAPLFDDNFKRTTGLGANWTVTIGSYTTDGAAAVSGAPPVGGNWAKVNASLGTNDYEVTSDVVVPAGSLYSGIVARGGLNFDDDLYAEQISTDGNVYLYRRNVGTWTVLGTAAAGITAGTKYSLKLVVSGSNPVHLEAWLNGAVQIVVDDTSASRLQGGVPGVENYDANVRYSSFAVYAGPAFADRFTRTTGLGSGWATVWGTYTTDGSGAVSGAPPTQGNWARVATPLSTTDYAIEADLTIPAGSLFSGVVGRSAVASAFDSDLYAAQISTDGSIYLYRRNGWNWTTLTSVQAGIVAGVRYTLKLVAVGSDPVHLEAWLNGSKRLQFNDASTSQLRTGGAGIENYDAGVRYGTFSVYPR